MKYLAEHVEEILSAMRHSKDLLGGESASWETTAWTRCKADAVRLLESLREGVCAQVDLVEGCTDACIGLVRRNERGETPIRWGVLVRLARRDVARVRSA